MFRHPEKKNENMVKKGTTSAKVQSSGFCRAVFIKVVKNTFCKNNVLRKLIIFTYHSKFSWNKIQNSSDVLLIKNIHIKITNWMREWGRAGESGRVGKGGSWEKGEMGIWNEDTYFTRCVMSSCKVSIFSRGNCDMRFLTTWTCSALVWSPKD